MTSTDAEVSFAFIRPLWLLGLLLLPGFALAWRRIQGTNGWEAYIDPGKLTYLKIVTVADRSPLRGIVITWFAFALVALAGPSWRTLPTPVGQTRDAMIIAFDLSPSMLGTDLSPNRLTRARLKIIDLLRLRQEGETALIAYADDAYRVSPLTDDTSTIEALVPSLHPNIMPGPGSQVEDAVDMARRLLEGASIKSGVLLVVTDGIDSSAMGAVEDALGDSLRLCILGVGSDEGTPIPIRGGGFARDQNGRTVLARLNRAELQSLASRSGSCYADLTTDDSDIESILNALGPRIGDTFEDSAATFDIRQDEGYWIIFLLLPFAALGFRRNVLWALALGLPSLILTATPSQALEWADLWQRSDQRDFEEITDGVNAYREGDYKAAAERFRGDSGIEHYNRANALALEGEFEEALDSYDRALKQSPENEDAWFNRGVVEELMEEQENRSEDSGSDESDGDDEEKQGDESNDGSPGDDSDDQDSSETQSDESSQASPPDEMSDESQTGEDAEDQAAEASDTAESEGPEKPGEDPESGEEGTDASPSDHDQAPLSRSK